MAPPVTRPASWLRAPARRFTAVWEAPPPADMPPSTAPPNVASPVATNSRLGRTGGSPLCCERSSDGHRFGEAHQRDAEGAGPELREQRKIGQREAGQTARNLPDGLDSIGAETEQRHGGDARGDGDERSGQAGREAFQAEQERHHRDAERKRNCGRLGQTPEQSDEILEERALREMHAEQLRYLIEHDHDADAGLEAGQHRLRDERGEESEAQDGGEHEQDADHRRQRGGRASAARPDRRRGRRERGWRP